MAGRDLVMLMDFDPGIIGIASQPFWLHWLDERDRSRRHAPDFFARRAAERVDRQGILSGAHVPESAPAGS